MYNQPDPSIHCKVRDLLLKLPAEYPTTNSKSNSRNAPPPRTNTSSNCFLKGKN